MDPRPPVNHGKWYDPDRYIANALDEGNRQHRSEMWSIILYSGLVWGGLIILAIACATALIALSLGALHWIGNMHWPLT